MAADGGPGRPWWGPPALAHLLEAAGLAGRADAGPTVLRRRGARSHGSQAGWGAPETLLRPPPRCLSLGWAPWQRLRIGLGAEGGQDAGRGEGGAAAPQQSERRPTRALPPPPQDRGMPPCPGGLQLRLCSAASPCMQLSGRGKVVAAPPSLLGPAATPPGQCSRHAASLRPLLATHVSPLPLPLTCRSRCPTPLCTPPDGGWARAALDRCAGCWQRFEAMRCRPAWRRSPTDADAPVMRATLVHVMPCLQPAALPCPQHSETPLLPAAGVPGHAQPKVSQRQGPETRGGAALHEYV